MHIGSTDGRGTTTDGRRQTDDGLRRHRTTDERLRRQTYDDGRTTDDYDDLLAAKRQAGGAAVPQYRVPKPVVHFAMSAESPPWRVNTRVSASSQTPGPARTPDAFLMAPDESDWVNEVAHMSEEEIGSSLDNPRILSNAASSTAKGSQEVIATRKLLKSASKKMPQPRFTVMSGKQVKKEVKLKPWQAGFGIAAKQKQSAALMRRFETLRSQDVEGGEEEDSEEPSEDDLPEEKAVEEPSEDDLPEEKAVAEDSDERYASTMLKLFGPEAQQAPYSDSDDDQTLFIIIRARQLEDICTARQVDAIMDSSTQTVGDPLARKVWHSGLQHVVDKNKTCNRPRPTSHVPRGPYLYL
jgi:hypothetical protein